MASTAPDRVTPGARAPRVSYLGDGDASAFAQLDLPQGDATGTGVLFCPPLGWDEIGSHRVRREWARALAAAGHATLRLDYPGTGDSAGTPHDPDLYGRWVTSVREGAETLRAAGAPRVVALGLGIGGLVAISAIAAGAPIDDVVLWATPSRGRALVRELKAFGRLEQTYADDTYEPPPGSIAVGGFLLAAPFVEQLGGIDVAALELQLAPGARALVLARDGVDDPDLPAALAGAGYEVETADGPGWAAMTEAPTHAVLPLDVMRRLERWLAEAPPAAGARGTGHASSADELALGDGIREAPLAVPYGASDLFGIVCEPAAETETELALVLLNAGAVRRVGPNRMWVEIARRWAARGVPSYRFDFAGIGDSDGLSSDFVDPNQLYDARFRDQLTAALDALQARWPERRFVAVGLCSGGYWAFRGVLEDERVLGACALNPGTLTQGSGLENARDAGTLVRRAAEPGAWLRLLRGEVTMPLGRIVGALRFAVKTALRRALRRSSPAAVNAIDGRFDDVCALGKWLLLLVSEDEWVRKELAAAGILERLDHWPCIEVVLAPGGVHTLRPLPMQAAAHAAVDRALERASAAGGGHL